MRILKINEAFLWYPRGLRRIAFGVTDRLLRD
jgi:hypothetical protein